MDTVHFNLMGEVCAAPDGIYLFEVRSDVSLVKMDTHLGIS